MTTQTWAFQLRISEAERFAKEIFQDLENLGFNVALNGAEHTHPNFVSCLKQSTDQTSLAIRFQPDGVACIGDIPKSVYIEAKDARTIERLAYEQYMKLHQAGNTVIVIFGKHNKAWNYVQNLKFIPSKEIVSKYSNPFPIVDDDWIAPRKSNHLNLIQQYNPRITGTQYKEVDPKSLYPYEVIEVLKYLLT